jgi:hypothetical protein
VQVYHLGGRRRVAKDAGGSEQHLQVIAKVFLITEQIRGVIAAPESYHYQTGGYALGRRKGDPAGHTP